MKKLWLVVLSGVLLLVAEACAGSAPAVTLPKEAQKLSDVVPAMGEHWGNPANLPLGPIYLVYQGEVIGLEYMWTEPMMQELKIPTPQGTEELSALPSLPIGVKIDHVDIAHMHQGHEGFIEPHWDIHLYFITPDEKNAIKPGG